MEQNQPMKLKPSVSWVWECEQLDVTLLLIGANWFHNCCILNCDKLNFDIVHCGFCDISDCAEHLDNFVMVACVLEAMPGRKIIWILISNLCF